MHRNSENGENAAEIVKAGPSFDGDEVLLACIMANACGGSGIAPIIAEGNPRACAPGAACTGLPFRVFVPFRQVPNFLGFNRFGDSVSVTFCIGILRIP